MDWLRELEKSDTMMLMGVEAKVSLSAVIDVAEGMVQSMPLPFGRSHGPLITSYLTAAKNWCDFEEAPGKMVFGSDAAKLIMQLILKSGDKAKPDPKLIMKVAPFIQLLEPDHQKLLRKRIEGLAEASPGGLKRLDSKQSLGLLKTKKIVAQASVSSGSGATMKLDLFDV